MRSMGNFTVHQKPEIGDTKISSKDGDHAGWLKCDGRQLDIYLFNQLYQAIGTKYGGANIAFNLPNPKGRVLGVMGDGPGLTSRAQGATVGAETHLLTEPELPSMTKTTITNSGHAHSHNANAGSPGYGLLYRDGTGTVVSSDNSGSEPNIVAAPGALTVNNESAHTHTIQIGGSQVHNNMQPTMFVGNMFIYCGRPNVGTFPYTPKDYKYYKNPGTR